MKRILFACSLSYNGLSSPGLGSRVGGDGSDQINQLIECTPSWTERSIDGVGEDALVPVVWIYLHIDFKPVDAEKEHIDTAEMPRFAR